MRAHSWRLLGIAFTALAAWLVGPAVPPARANLIGLMPHSPDCSSFFIAASFDANTHVFSASGVTASFDVDNLPPPDYDIDQPGTFDLSVTLTPAGVPTGGTLALTGTIAGIGANSGTLLTGTISQFGFETSPSAHIFEFVFDVTGGDLAPYYTGHKAGVVLDTGTLTPSFTGTFTSSFQNDGISGRADTFSQAVPEPSTLAVLISLIVAGSLAGALRVGRWRPAGT